MDCTSSAEESQKMGKVIDMRTLEVKRQIRRHEYSVDADAVAEAIVRRLTARRAAPGAADRAAGVTRPVAPEEPAGLVS
jgi:hypothetical protein